MSEDNNIIDAIISDHDIAFGKLSKDEMLYHLTGIKKNIISQIFTIDKSNKQKNRFKYLAYLYSDKVQKERIIELKNNSEFLARYWKEIKKLTEEIKIDEFDEYPELMKYYELWCNTIQGESLLYTVGCGNIKYGKAKYGKKLFKRYQLDVKWEEPKKEIPVYRVNPELTDNQLRTMYDLNSVGFKGFYLSFAAITKENKTPVFVLFDNRFYPDVVLSEEQANKKCGTILNLIISGQLKIMQQDNDEGVIE